MQYSQCGVYRKCGTFHQVVETNTVQLFLSALHDFYFIYKSVPFMHTYFI